MCNEETLKKLLEEKLAEHDEKITNAFIEEINKLKAEQEKVIKEAISESLKENFERIFEKKLNDIDKKIEAGAKHLNENDIKIAKLLEQVGREIVKAFKKINEHEEAKITELGNQILEVLDDLGNTLLTAQDGIMDLQNSWGDTMLKRFRMVIEQEVELKRMLENMQSREDSRFNLLFDVTKSTKDLINRSSFGI